MSASIATATGGRVADLTVLEGVLEGTGTHIFAIVHTDQDGIVFAGDWDNLGQRLTESGSVQINDVRVDWAGAAGFVDKVFLPLVYNTLNVPALHAVFNNFYLGIAEGASQPAAAYTREYTRAWPYRGEVAVRIAAAKLRIIEDGLEVATRIYELTGARASSNKVGLDIHWRNLRTHSLHDPVPYKKHEVGKFVLLNEIPQPTWYS